MVRLDTLSSESYEVVYHEYVHSVMHLNTRWLPVWLDEGLADFHANTRFEKSRIFVGGPSWRLRVVRSRPLIPLSVLFDVTPGSPYYHDEDKADIFYAESWLLTHYLFFGPGMENGRKLLRFITLLEDTDQKKAFQKVFGDPAEIQKGLDLYLRSFTLAGGYLNTPITTDEKQFTVRRMSVAETEAELGSYHLWSRDPDLARPLIERALQNDPKLGLAHEDLAFLDFDEGRDDDAVREFSQAVTLDPKLYLSLFSLTMMSPASRLATPADQAAFESAMKKVLDQNPQFAPAFVQLARVYARRGDLQRAFGLSRRAEQLEPARAGYHIMSGQLLERMGHVADAAAFARYVATRWQGNDHDEAVELWNSIPPGQRPTGEAPASSSINGTKIVEGVVRSAHCATGNSDDDQGFTVVIEQGGRQLAFQATGIYQLGYSDTLWWGQDHFVPCRHVEGVRAVGFYRPSSDPKFTGHLLRLDFRDTLPAAAAPEKPARNKSAN